MSSRDITNPSNSLNSINQHSVTYSDSNGADNGKGTPPPVSVSPVRENREANLSSPTPTMTINIDPSSNTTLSSIDDALQLWEQLASINIKERKALLSKMNTANTSTTTSTSTNQDSNLLHFCSSLRSAINLIDITSKTSNLSDHTPQTLSSPSKKKEEIDSSPSTEQTIKKEDSPSLTQFVTWFFGLTFPSPSSSTINHFYIRSPIKIIDNIFHTPFSLYGKSPTAAKPASWWQAIWTFIGVFTAIACIGILHQYYTNSHYDWPILFASHGALTTIIFVTPSSTPSQPYPILAGTLISTFLAVTIQQNMDATNHLWLAVALSAASSIAVMQLLACAHPPGGALSILYIAVPTLHVLGYWYIIAAETGSIIVILVSLIVNNIPNTDDRKYPSAWMG